MARHAWRSGGRWVSTVMAIKSSGTKRVGLDWPHVHDRYQKAPRCFYCHHRHPRPYRRLGNRARDRNPPARRRDPRRCGCMGGPLLGQEDHSNHHCRPVRALCRSIRRLPPASKEDWCLAGRAQRHCRLSRRGLCAFRRQIVPTQLCAPRPWAWCAFLYYAGC